MMEKIFEKPDDITKNMPRCSLYQLNVFHLNTDCYLPVLHKLR